MTKLTIKDYITIIMFLITIGTFVYKYGQLNAKVEEHDRILDKVNVEVLQILIEHNTKSLEKIETKVDRIIEIVE